MAPVTLETLAGDIALLRTELQAVFETLMRLDNQAAHLIQRLIALRDENLDTAAQLRDVRREVLASNRVQNRLGERLTALEQPASP
jgi:chromosome segregation ATPase